MRFIYIYIYIYYYICMYYIIDDGYTVFLDTLWLFNIAMENHNF